MPQALDYFQIHNLLYRYCDAVDRNDIQTLDALFAHADVHAGSPPLKAGSTLGFGEVFRRIVRMYPDIGTGKTRHLCTNVLVDFDDASHARCQSCFVVFQATDELPLQAIMTGRYLDRMIKVDGQWSFAEHRWETGLTGNLSAHLLQPPSDFDERAGEQAHV